MVEKVEFRGVWIPRFLWNDSAIGWSEKLLLAEIDRLSENGSCFASNGHFARFFDLSIGRISKLISALKEKGYIETYVTYKDNSKEVDKRFITTRGYHRKQQGGMDENNKGGIVENSEDNITVINRTIITNICPSVDEPLSFDIPDFFDDNVKSVDEKFNPEYTSPCKKIKIDVPDEVPDKKELAEQERLWKKLRFLEFWEKFKNKKGKAKVEPAFMKLKRDEIEQIIEVVDDHALIYSLREIQHRPHPITWINQKRWEDDISAEIKRLKPRSFVSSPKDESSNQW